MPVVPVSYGSLAMKRVIVISSALLLCLGTGVPAADGLRDYPNPGYHRMGVYAGGPRAYFDYSLSKTSLNDTFPNKKKFWAERKAAADNPRRGGESPHTVFTIFCGIRDGQPFEVCRRRIDAWLKPEPGIPTYPETIPAICLDEENITSTSRFDLLDRLARHIRDNYRIPVFQWFTDPAGPSTRLTADGWVWDSYGWSPERFRRHVMAFVLMGKPVICIPWASDPHWPQWTQYPSTTALINREWHQFTTCMEFNVSTAPFCVAGPGAMNPWLGSDTPDMIHLRRALKAKRRQMHALPLGSLPLASANFSQAVRQIPIGGDPGKPSRYVDDFGGPGILQDASITGFLDMMLTSRPADPGFLVIRPRPGPGGKRIRRAVDASLIYDLESYFPLRKIRVTLKATAPDQLKAINSISLHATQWDSEIVKPIAEVRGGQGGLLVLEAGPEVVGMRRLRVRIGLKQGAGDSTDLSHRIDQLVIEAEHELPDGDAVAKLTGDDYGNLGYDDDLSTSRWQHLGSFSTSHESHCGRRGSEFWIGLKGGFAISGQLLQRFSAGRRLKQLTVQVNGYANGPDLGGGMVVEIAPRGGKAIWKAAAKGRHSGPLVLEVPAKDLVGVSPRVPDGLQEFDVRVTLSSASGVEQGKKACATLNAISIRAK